MTLGPPFLGSHRTRAPDPTADLLALGREFGVPPEWSLALDPSVLIHYWALKKGGAHMISWRAYNPKFNNLPWLRHSFTHPTVTTFFLRVANLSPSTVALLAKWVHRASKVQLPSPWCASKSPAPPGVANSWPLGPFGETTMIRLQRGSPGLPQYVAPFD